MIGRAWKWFRKRQIPWDLIGIALLLLFAYLIYINLDKLRSDGLMPDEQTKETTEAEAKAELLDHNVVQIRNEVYVWNGEEMSAKELDQQLSRLKAERPDAVVELKASGDEKAGMAHELQRMVEANRLKYQK